MTDARWRMNYWYLSTGELGIFEDADYEEFV